MQTDGGAAESHQPLAARCPQAATEIIQVQESCWRPRGRSTRAEVCVGSSPVLINAVQFHRRLYVWGSTRPRSPGRGFVSSPCHIKKKKKDYFAGCPVQGIMVSPSPHPQGLREAFIVSWGALLAGAQGPCPPGLVRSSLQLSSPSSTTRPPSSSPGPAPPDTPPLGGGRSPRLVAWGSRSGRALHARPSRVSRGASAAGTGARRGHLGA